MIDDERDLPGDLKTKPEKESEKEATGKTGDWRCQRAALPPTNEDADLGTALRNVYQKTVEEEVPAEMLDLLKRLS